MKIILPDVKNIIAVASGKGGVGKTTVTVNLALALQQQGAKVGIFDADVYGPNVPIMLGIHRSKAAKGLAAIARRKNATAYIQPLNRFGLNIMSIGLLVGENEVIDPARSPAAVGQLVVQTLKDVIWGELDYLLIDLPPSAGQPQASLIQRVPLRGVVIVTTPQDLSLLDASRSLLMFQEANVPVLGIVENMSYFICPNCDERHQIFQRSAKWRPTALADAPILGQIPLTTAVSQSINAAHPLMHDHPDTPQADAFLEVTTALRQQLVPPTTA
ncbi:MAG: Mrp/NBP35 family ATP-binding protein [Anaerolineales bacterium]|nr:Mrp/NBP35 family ATP-binding protein [Anaerolineales bacterium]